MHTHACTRARTRMHTCMHAFPHARAHAHAPPCEHIHTRLHAHALQVSDEQLALLQEMGHGMRESTRALRFSGGNITAALDFIQTQRAQAKVRAATGVGGGQGGGHARSAVALCGPLCGSSYT